MPIPITCSCGRDLLVKDEYAGHSLQCPDCGRELIVPGANPPDPADSGGRYDQGKVPVSFEPQPFPFSSGPIKPPDVPAKTSGMAIASLVLGLVSPLFCCFTGIPGLILGILGLRAIGSSNGRLRGKGLAITGIVIGAITLLALPGLVPAIREGIASSQRIKCINNLKLMCLAAHEFDSAHGFLPAQAITDAEGRPLLSWRVAILPYLGRQDLYQQFHLDEPWDSPHNRALLPLMPDVYACPLSTPGERKQGMTHYLAITGIGTLFDPEVVEPDGPGVTLGVSLPMVTDGTANTILAVDAAPAVEWTRPDDLSYEAGGPLPALGARHSGWLNVVFLDGSVPSFRSSIPEAALRSFFTRDGGEMIPRDDY